jgi:Tol biopolymer transport system component
LANKSLSPEGLFYFLLKSYGSDASMTKNLLIAGLLSLIIVIIVFGLTGCGSHKTYWIAFTAMPEEHEQIHMIKSDGTNHINLSANSKWQFNPVWSPDGTKLVFVNNDENDNSDIYTLDLVSGSRVQLTHGGNNTSPVWSPDNSKLAFVAKIGDFLQVFVMNADGSGEQQLTDTDADNWAPSWLEPTRIVYASNRDGNAEIYIMKLDGSKQINLTNNSALDDSPVCSPDGKIISFRSRRDSNYEIYSMNTDGSNPFNLTRNKADDENPVWSHNGKRIAFVSKRNGSEDIYLMDFNGSKLTRLTSNPAADCWPSWSPDDSEIVYASFRDTNWELFKTNITNGNQAYLTQTPIDEFEPFCAPK